MPRSPTIHTYDKTCIYYAPETIHAIIVESDHPPPVRAQYFYLVSFDIDDVFTPLPPVLPQSQDGSNATVISNVPPQPFSGGDNEALEKAWEDMCKKKRKSNNGRLAGEGDAATTSGRATNPIQINVKTPTRASVAPPSSESLLKEGMLDGVPAAESPNSREDNEIARDLRTGLLTKDKTFPGMRSELLRSHARGESYSSTRGHLQGHEWAQHKPPTRQSLPHHSYFSRIPRSTPSLAALAAGSSKDGHHIRQPSPSKAPPRPSNSMSELPTDKPERPTVPLAPAPLPTPSPSAIAGMETPPRQLSSAMSTWSGGQTRSRHGSTSGSPFARAPIRNKKFLSLRWGSGEDIDNDEDSGTVGSHGYDNTMRARSATGCLDDGNLARDDADSSYSSSNPFSSFPPQQPPLSSTTSLTSKLSPKKRRVQTPLHPPPLLSITVGYSRLYTVHYPSLTLRPIYWSPVGDVAPVIRGTWFYKNSLLPLEPELANRLEEGYRYMRPWTTTWQDEMNSCVENGADAEQKIVWKLFSGNEEDEIADMECNKGQEVVADNDSIEGEQQKRRRAGKLKFDQSEAAGPAGRAIDAFKTCSVIYVNSRDAQILRPTLLPSASRGRRPLSAIRKGREIGVPVVRGFDRKSWDKMHPPKLPATSARKLMKMYQPNKSSAQGLRGSKCPGCQLEEKKLRPTDLVLVIHGIGQKLSERVESFNFTHHINGFRRQVNIEMNEDSVWPTIRDEMEGLMVLPVNWRAILSREDEDVQALTNDDPNANNFTLKDVTPDTVPYVRNMISDVMLDIPYYLSDHKPKMIAAVTKEANRIYRLWCANNPGFHEYGRTHLIAHSLGSVMAVDILSKQPTRLPPSLDLSLTGSTATEVSEEMFEFDTRNLFLCGSPTGFFLLLNRASLLPRRGRNKPGSEGDDQQRGITGEQGTYGCLAIDNIYNIMHDTDPISYCLNATVDRDLAATLKLATIPSSQTTWMQSLSNALSFSSSTTTETKGADTQRRTRGFSQTVQIPGKGGKLTQRHLSVSSNPNQPSSPTNPGHLFFSPSAASFDHDQYNASDPDSENPLTQLPSNVELETHDFTREEIAERRMYLLNDNGQIDYYMSGNAGPLSIQYLNMLSAHTNYWSNVDFIRFLVLETGRKSGRKGTIAALRAKKKKGWKGE
ncbi:hypothetical protein KEM54_000017 [Ascosphaera aggregata]|nr:hypothetical protein KEM54_000017 [Ascosphaera aggregata]